MSDEKNAGPSVFIATSISDKIGKENEIERLRQMVGIISGVVERHGGSTQCAFREEGWEEEKGPGIYVHRDFSWCKDCDGAIIIAEDSHGVRIEEGWLSAMEKPMLRLFDGIARFRSGLDRYLGMLAPVSELVFSSLPELEAGVERFVGTLASGRKPHVREVIANGLEEAFHSLLERFEQGQDVHEVSPRGQKSKDLLNCQLIVENPRDRLIFNPIRRINLAAIIGETLWYLRGSDSLEEIAYYVPQMERFSDDGATINSAYGKRLVHMKRIVEQMRLDPDTKRACHPILFPDDLETLPDTKDFPCTFGVQWLNRGNKLDMISYMRSSDVFWGLQHDVFFFMFLQEMIALETGSQLGNYRHVAGVFNIYERHYEKAERIRQCPKEASTPMCPLRSLDELEELKRQEPLIRSGNTRTRELEDELLEDFRLVLLHKRTKDDGYLRALSTKAMRRAMVR
jgi:thymidylate synthase